MCGNFGDYVSSIGSKCTAQKIITFNSPFKLNFESRANEWSIHCSVLIGTNSFAGTKVNRFELNCVRAHRINHEIQSIWFVFWRGCVRSCDWKRKQTSKIDQMLIATTQNRNSIAVKSLTNTLNGNHLAYRCVSELVCACEGTHVCAHIRLDRVWVRSYVHNTSHIQIYYIVHIIRMWETKCDYTIHECLLNSLSGDLLRLNVGHSFYGWLHQMNI